MKEVKAPVGPACDMDIYSTRCLGQHFTGLLLWPPTYLLLSTAVLFCSGPGAQVTVWLHRKAT